MAVSVGIEADWRTRVQVPNAKPRQRLHASRRGASVNINATAAGRRRPRLRARVMGETGDDKRRPRRGRAPDDGGVLGGLSPTRPAGRERARAAPAREGGPRAVRAGAPDLTPAGRGRRRAPPDPPPPR